MRERKLGRGVAVVGAGMGKYGVYPGLNSRDLFVDAYQDMLASVQHGVNPQDIEAVYLGNFSSDLFEGQGHNAPILADWVGLAPRPATRVEDACASGGVALRQGILAIASGLYDLVLVGGAEKMTTLPTERVTDVLTAAADTFYEIPAGFTFPGFYAAIASAYMACYKTPPESLMSVAIKNHANGALNDKAQFGVTIQAAMEKAVARAVNQGNSAPAWANIWDFLRDPRANPPIAWPLRLYDCSPVTDGAAAVLLAAEDIARIFTDEPLYIIGSGQASDGAVHNRPDLKTLRAARLAGQQAYAMAGVTPRDIKLAEVHDCFTIAEIIATEDLGFFAPGQGGGAAEAGETARTGSLPVNTSGGLKSKGHPVGASGVGQVVELWKQMHGLAGARQVPGTLDLGLTHNVGGTGLTCAVHIFEKR